MPGFELINHKEKKAVNEVFKNGSVFFRHGFDNLRKNKYFVQSFENKFSKYIGVKYALGVTSGTAEFRVALAALELV